MNPDVFPRWERTTYWIVALVALLYALWNLHLEGDKYKSSLYFFERGWSWLGRDQDTSDFEWIVYRNSFKRVILMNILHVILSKICALLAVRVKTRVCILVAYDIFALNVLYGVRPFLVFLAKFFCMYGTSRLASVPIVWITAFVITVIDIHPSSAVYQQKFLHLNDQDGSLFNYIVASGFFDLHLISFSLEKIVWNARKEQMSQRDSFYSLKPEKLKLKLNRCETTEPNFLDCLFYAFHLPKFCNGPFYSFTKFHSEVQECFSATTNRVNLTDIVIKLLRFMVWALFLELQSHYFYSSGLSFSESVVNKMSLSAVMAAGYWQGQMFMVKYVCMYGISGQLLRFDGVIPHANPRCIGWVYSYTDMWKYFDVGLYQFVKNYIYIPLGGSQSGLFRQILSSALSFLFIYIWHGAQWNLLFWCLGSFITGTLETLGHHIELSPFGTAVKRRLSPAMQLRLRAVLTVPVYLVSCWSVFFFFFGTDVTWVMIKKMTQASRLKIFLEILVLSSAVQNAIYITEWRQTVQLANKNSRELAASTVSNDYELDSDDEMEVAASAVVILNAEQENRLWVREWLLQRPTLGAYATLVQELSIEDSRSYKAFVRIAHDNFMEILERVGPLIKKQDTIMRRAIPPGERLAVTLRYLGSGSSFTDLMFLFRMADCTVYNIVMETCDALYTALKDDFMKGSDPSKSNLFRPHNLLGHIICWSTLLMIRMGILFVLYL